MELLVVLPKRRTRSSSLDATTRAHCDKGSEEPERTGCFRNALAVKGPDRLLHVRCWPTRNSDLQLCPSSTEPIDFDPQD